MSNQAINTSRTVLLSCAVSNRSSPTNNQIQLNLVHKVQDDIQRKLNIEPIHVYLTLQSKTENYESEFESSDINHIQQYDVILKEDSTVDTTELKNIISESINNFGFNCSEVLSTSKETYTLSS